MNNPKLILIFAFTALCMPNFINAQSIGIGTTTPNGNSMLDISSSNKGLLIPRVALTSTTSASPLGAFVAGMMVYNTATAGTPPNNVTPGFYLCNGVQWERPIGGSTGGWSLTGNSGTNSTINFIGTTDNQDVVLKRNNVRAGLINETGANTSFGALSLNPANTGEINTAFGYGVLGSNTTGEGNLGLGVGVLYNNTTGDGNIGLGYQSLLSNTGGNANIAIGAEALALNKTGEGGIAIGNGAMTKINNTTTPYDNTNIAIGTNALIGSSTPANNTGLNNIAIGFESMADNSSGNRNVALGIKSLRTNMTGYGNIAIGSDALFTNNSGLNNTAIGDNAGYSSIGNENVFIGSNAGYNETGNNRLYISNSNGDANNALIYGEFDNKKFRVNGKTESFFVTSFDDTPAVHGKNDNTDFYGIGVTGKGGWKGVEGIVAGTGSQHYFGVYGNSVNSNTGSNYGLYGTASASVNNYGVYGLANSGSNKNYGVYGSATSGSNNYGIYGVASGSNNYAGYFEGAVAIGDFTPVKATGHMLSVDGKIACTEVRVQPTNLWPDYVFSSKYNLMPLHELEKSINDQKHLPGIPSAKEVENDGIQVGEMQRKMMEKIEELTLYIIDLNKKIESLQSDNNLQAEQIKTLSNK